MHRTTSRLRRWPAAAWAEWAEWTSRSERSVRLIGRAGGAIRWPFFISSHVVEHVLGLVELGGLFGRRRWRFLVLARGENEKGGNDEAFHRTGLPPGHAIKK